MAEKWNLDAERDLWAAICAPNSWYNEKTDLLDTHPDSLYWFVRKCWSVDAYFVRRGDEARWFQDRIHKPYLKWLQTHLLAWMKQRAEGSTDQYFITCILPRGYGKTVSASKCGSLWLELADPDLSLLYFSSTHPLARDILSSVQSVISGNDKDSWFTWLYGNWQDSMRQWSKDSCVHKYRVSTNLSEPSLDTSATEIGATGYHHDCHFVDDPISKNKLREGGTYMTGVHSAVDALYNALKPNGLMMFVLTRYLDDDVSGRHLKNEGIADWSGMRNPNTVMFDKVDYGKGNWHVYFLQAEDENGKAVLPEVYNETKIAAHKRRDPEDFACQYQNNPGAGEHTPLLEWQLRDCFVDYRDVDFVIPIMAASIHIDTAFKNKENVGKGDSSAIVVWLHDERPNGLIYLDTDLMFASNEWRAEDFNDKLIKNVLIPLRKRGIHIKCITDEREGMGKDGVFANQIKALLTGAGFNIRFEQLNRQGKNKRKRIRTATSYYVEGYVRLLLHKTEQLQPDGTKKLMWHETPVIRTLMNQLLRIDVVDHDDLADAATDVFAESLRIWRRPVPLSALGASEEGAWPTYPGVPDGWDRNERVLGKAVADQIYETEREMVAFLGEGHGPDDYNVDAEPSELRTTHH